MGTEREDAGSGAGRGTAPHIFPLLFGDSWVPWEKVFLLLW